MKGLMSDVDPECLDPLRAKWMWFKAVTHLSDMYFKAKKRFYSSNERFEETVSVLSTAIHEKYQEANEGRQDCERPSEQIRVVLRVILACDFLKQYNRIGVPDDRKRSPQETWI